MIASGLHYRQSKKASDRQIEEQQKTVLEKIHFWDLVRVSEMELRNSMGSANRSLQRFLNATDISGKAAEVSNGYEHIGEMTSYYANRPFEVALRDPSLIRNRLGVININGKNCLLFVLKFKNESKWELSFYPDSGGNWKLDWPAFVRYQPMDWQEFVHGSDNYPDGLEFRVWALRDKPEEDPDHYAVRFIAPPPNGSKKQGVFSPPVKVPKNSEIGRQFYKFYRINELQNPAYRILSADDNDSYIRMRAILSKSDNENQSGKVFKLEKIVMEGWYDDPPE